MNRTEINRALAKALAYAECGKFDQAKLWGEILIVKLTLAGVFKGDGVTGDGVTGNLVGADQTITEENRELKAGPWKKGRIVDFAATERNATP